jgi:formylglycine-generating enzyme required for sulfatase activity
MDQLFDDIESQCGLLKFENSQYSYWHLAFQEFLTADYISDNSSDHIAAIQSYWGDEWWEESLALYIGYLSIEHMRTANDIIAQALDSGDKTTFARWRLAARSLLDIHQSRRDPHVVRQAGSRLIEIIDKGAEPKALADAGETLGWLGDPRELQTFVAVEGGEYDLEDLGTHTIASFEIGRYPVTNAWFAEFMAAGGYETESLWSPEGQKWLGRNKPKQPVYWDERRWKCPNAPVVGVCWYEADAFCRWLTADRKDGHTYFLPSEIQWQAAAAGKEKREFPWVGEITTRHCNYVDTKIGNTAAVGIFKIGNTPEGVADMAGNVWEWIDSWYDNDEDTRVLRGGSWIYTARDCRCAARSNSGPDSRHGNIGFRCARI